MRGRALARGLVLIVGTIAALLAFASWSSAADLPGRDLGVTSAAGFEGSGAHTGVVAAQTGPPALGGGLSERFHGGDASGAFASTPDVRVSAPVTYHTQPTQVFHGPPVAFTPTVTSAVAPPSPRRLPHRSRGTTVTAPPIAASQAAPVTFASPTVFGHRFPGTVIQGQNTSEDAEAISGDVEVTNELDVTVGPSGGFSQQFGNNRVRIDQHSVGVSGAAIAGSQVFGTHGRGFFFDDDDDFFFDDPFFFDHDFGRRFNRHVGHARLRHLELLADLAEDCLDRLEHRPSHALLHICHHRIERLADDLHDLTFFDHFFGPDVFFSRGGTHALFGFGGAAIRSPRGAAHFGPLGASFAGRGGAASVGFGGFATTFPFGSASSEDADALLFAPFGLAVAPIHGGLHHRANHFGSFVDHGFQREIARLRHALAHLEDQLEWLEHHRRLVLGTIHSHSFFDDDPVFFTPFGHRTVFTSDNAVFVPSHHPVFFDDDNFFRRHHHFRHHHFRHRHHHFRHHHFRHHRHHHHHRHFHRRHCRDFFFGDRCFRRGPVLDLPGLGGADGFRL